MLELTQKRTLHSKTHDLGNGQYRLTASMIPMHYEENGALHDIDMTIQNGVVNSGIYKVELLTDKIGFRAIDRGTNKTITVSIGKIGNQSVAYSAPQIDVNKASWPSIKPGVDIEFVFNNHQVNIFRVLQNAQAAKVAEWDVDEELGEKTIKMNDNVRGRDAARNETKHTVLITPPDNQPNRKTYTIRDTFEDRVYKRNPQTRVKEESVDVQYPVRIDPTVTVSISANADDGQANGNGATYSSFKTNTSSINLFDANTVGGHYRSKGYFRFNGITVPQSSTINSAQINYYGRVLRTPTQQFTVLAKKLNNPAAPTNYAQVMSPATLASNQPHGTASGTAGFTLQNVSVQSLVQELVNSFDYSNESMLFFLRVPQSTTFNTIKVIDYSHPTLAPFELVIDYTAGGGGGVNRLSRMTTLGCG